MIWNNLDDLEKKEKIDAICKDLLEKLSKIEDWIKTGNHGVEHKNYNLEVYGHIIRRPRQIDIPMKWRRRIKHKIKKIYHYYAMRSLSFLHDVILDKYPLHDRITDKDRKEWLKENANEGDYITDSYWYYFKNESLAVAYKLRWM